MIRKDKTYYLAGPMSGIPQFNFPEFRRVTELLRARGVKVISPAELDEINGTAAEAVASTDGDATKLTATWGDLLSRDVKLISDSANGIIFLRGWHKSRGARLEAFVGLLQKDFDFHLVDDQDGVVSLPRSEVAYMLYMSFTPSENI